MTAVTRASSSPHSSESGQLRSALLSRFADHSGQKKSLGSPLRGARDPGGRSFLTATDEASASPTREVSATLRPALPWAKGSRVPASASGLKRVWFRRLHHPRRRCAPCLVPRRQAASNRGTSQTLTFQGKRVLLVPARPLGPSGSGLVPDGLGPPFSPDHNSSCDLDPSLKLRILGSEEKGIRGTDADLRSLPRCARRELIRRSA